jgi:serine/threonine protein kinase
VEEGFELHLERTWTVGELIGRGGFGKVHAVSDGDVQAAAKFVPKTPGSERELLLTDVPDARNVIQIIEAGETDDDWVLVMPRAEYSLRDFLGQRGQLNQEEAVTVLIEVAQALADLDGRIVHRDLKPESLLYWGGSWCLTDFGISRYAEAATASDTRKFALSPRTRRQSDGVTSMRLGRSMSTP